MKLSILINMDWQSCNGLRKTPDAGIDCSHLYGTSFIDGFARVASTKEKTIGTAIGAVGGLVSRSEQAGNDTHENHSPFISIEKSLHRNR